MNIRLYLRLVAVVLLGYAGAFADVAQLQNSDQKLDVIKRDGVILLHVDQTAKAWNWTVKIVGEGDSRLLAVCRETICLPISLRTTRHVESKAGLFLDAKTLGA